LPAPGDNIQRGFHPGGLERHGNQLALADRHGGILLAMDDEKGRIVPGDIRVIGLAAVAFALSSSIGPSISASIAAFALGPISEGFSETS